MLKDEGQNDLKLGIQGVGRIPVGLAGACAVATNGTIVMAGGENDRHVFDAVWAWDVNTDNSGTIDHN